MRTLPSSAGSAVSAIAEAVRRPGDLVEPPQLLALAAAVAGAEADWRPMLRHDPERRWYARLFVSPEVEIWLLGWSAGQETGLHDHGDVWGAFHVVEGTLVEDVVDRDAPGIPLHRHHHRPGTGVRLWREHTHNVANPGPRLATSIHAYSPPITTMRFYGRDRDGRLLVTHTLDVGGDEPGPPLVPEPVRERPAGRRGVEAMLASARRRLDRLEPREAAAALADGGLLVDIRPVEQRRAHGEVPGAVVIERNVLEWRLDPASDARIREASHDGVVVILCHQGYASSLAAASLRDLGITGATDVIGGFEAWATAGLPIVRR